MEERNNQFLKRIDLERKVFKIVNTNFPKTPLMGLTRKAIDFWKDKLSDKESSQKDIVNILYQISMLAQIENDSSKDVFDFNSIKSQTELTQLLNKLEEILM